MNKKEAELISRGVDSELNAEERKQLGQLLAENPDAATLSRNWESIGDRLRTDAVDAEPPDAFRAWQDIRREIRQSPEAVKEPAKGSPRLRWVGAIAAVLVVGLLALSAWKLISGSAPEFVWDDDEPASRVDWVVTDIPGATTVIYTDEETDMTVIWMDIAQDGETRDS